MSQNPFANALAALLLLAGEQKSGVRLFLQTLGIFACITVALLASLFLFAGVK